MLYLLAGVPLHVRKLPSLNICTAETMSKVLTSILTKRTPKILHSDTFKTSSSNDSTPSDKDKVLCPPELANSAIGIQIAETKRPQRIKSPVFNLQKSQTPFCVHLTPWCPAKALLQTSLTPHTR